MKVLILICLLALPCLTLAQDSSVTSSSASGSAPLDGWKWSGGIGLLRNGQRIELDFVTPTFARWGKGDRSHLSVYFDVAAVTIHDAYLLDNTYQRSRNIGLGLGLRYTEHITEMIHSYVKIGADYVAMEPNLRNSGNSANWGYLLTAGFDLLFSRPIGHPDSRQSVFVDWTWREGHNRIDSLSGRPDLFNGVAITVGGRLHY